MGRLNFLKMSDIQNNQAPFKGPTSGKDGRPGIKITNELWGGGGWASSRQPTPVLHAGLGERFMEQSRRVPRSRRLKKTTKLGKEQSPSCATRGHNGHRKAGWYKQKQQGGRWRIAGRSVSMAPINPGGNTEPMVPSRNENLSQRSTTHESPYREKTTIASEHTQRAGAVLRAKPRQRRGQARRSRAQKYSFSGDKFRQKR